MLFIIGGCTYEESAHVNAANAKRAAAAQSADAAATSTPTPTSQSMPRVLLASTHVHNATSFVAQLAQFSGGGGAIVSAAAAH